MSFSTAYFTNDELKAMSLEDLRFELREAESLKIAYESDGWTNYARLTVDSIERLEHELRRRKS